MQGKQWVDKVKRMQVKKLRNQEGLEELFEAQHMGLAYERIGILPTEGASLPSNSVEPASGLNALMMNVNSQLLLDSGRPRSFYLVKHFTSATELSLIDGCLEEEVVILPDEVTGPSSTISDTETGSKLEPLSCSHANSLP